MIVPCASWMVHTLIDVALYGSLRTEVRCSSVLGIKGQEHVRRRQCGLRKGVGVTGLESLHGVLYLRDEKEPTLLISFVSLIRAQELRGRSAAAARVPEFPTGTGYIATASRMLSQDPSYDRGVLGSAAIIPHNEPLLATNFSFSIRSSKCPFYPQISVSECLLPTLLIPIGVSMNGYIMIPTTSREHEVKNVMTDFAVAVVPVIFSR